MSQFNYKSFLTYIVLALIIAVLIHLMFKLFVESKSAKNSHSTEKMTNIPNNKNGCRSCVQYNDANTDHKSDNKPISDKSSSDTKYDYYTDNDNTNVDDNTIPDNMPNYLDNSDASYGGSYVNQYFDPDYTCKSNIKNKQNRIKRSSDDTFDMNAQMDEITGLASKTPNQPNCRVCEYENTYTREFYENNQQPCPPKIEKMTDQEQQKYIDNFFNFRNFTEQNSHGVDAIDIMNTEYLATNGNMFQPKNDNGNGHKISDIYDAITADTHKTKDMMITPNYDNITMSPQFKMKGSNGAYYTNDTWLYKKDRVMNGGEFYDGVSGSDSNGDHYLSV